MLTGSGAYCNDDHLYRRSGLRTRQRSVGEMLRLAALPLAINDAEVHFDRMADRRVSVGRHLHKQHALKNSRVLLSESDHDTFDVFYLSCRWEKNKTYWLALIFVHCCLHFPDLLPV